MFLYGVVISKGATWLPLTGNQYSPPHLPVNQDRKLEDQMPAWQLLHSWWVLVLGWICKEWERSEGGPCRGCPAPLSSFLSFSAFSSFLSPWLFPPASHLFVFTSPNVAPKRQLWFLVFCNSWKFQNIKIKQMLLSRQGWRFLLTKVPLELLTKCFYGAEGKKPESTWSSPKAASGPEKSRAG